ncbi:MAG: DUF1343 domain-containing protein, partial [Bacteroidetes bacterium]
CFFEATAASVGRGTDLQFQVVGAPGFPAGDYTFTPEPKPGARHPKHQGLPCRGWNLSGLPVAELRRDTALRLHYLLDFFAAYEPRDGFFLRSDFFDKLAGTDSLRLQLLRGATEEEIRRSWAPTLRAFKAQRRRYLLYPED